MKTKKPDQEWRNLLNAKGFTKNYPFKNKRLEPIKQKLLRMGGWAVCLPDSLGDLDEYFNRGLKLGGKSTLKAGRPSNCHANSVELWIDSKEKIKICTGFALSEDGVWRVHTWGVQKASDKIKIFETTERRVLYYGYTLSRVESIMFTQMNNPEMLTKLDLKFF